jgi:hypothetical protein
MLLELRSLLELPASDDEPLIPSPCLSRSSVIVVSPRSMSLVSASFAGASAADLAPDTLQQRCHPFTEASS